MKLTFILCIIVIKQNLLVAELISEFENVTSVLPSQTEVSNDILGR